MLKERTGRRPMCSVGACPKEAEESAMRLQLPGPDARALVRVLNPGPARTGVCQRHYQGYLLARRAWKRAGSQVDDRRPRTPEEQRDSRGRTGPRPAGGLPLGVNAVSRPAEGRRAVFRGLWVSDIGPGQKGPKMGPGRFLGHQARASPGGSPTVPARDGWRLGALG